MNRIIIMFLILCNSALLYAQTYTLKAKDYDGKTQYFVFKEDNSGDEIWGIKTEYSGMVYSADMWFNSFPGRTGTYKVEFSVVLEPDGDPEYEVKAGSRRIKKGRYPYSGDSRNCEGATKKCVLNLGEHKINKGEKINVWGTSVYYCQDKDGKWHGAFTRWYELKFTKNNSNLEKSGTSNLE